MRSPADMDILVIDITNRCFLACSNCTRDIVHQTRTREMTPETFRTALASLRDWWRPGRVIGVIGGEPTLNKHFAEICRIFRDEFRPVALTLPQFIRSHSLNPGVLYGVARHDSSNPAEGEYAGPNGYFQLLHPRAAAIASRWPAVMSEEFCSAGGVDTWLTQQFPESKRVQIPGLAAVHIAHAVQHGEQWNGPPRGGQWRQFGMLTVRGIIPTESLPPGEGRKFRVRMVDTFIGRTWEGTIAADEALPLEVVRPVPDGLVWLGQPIGLHHIHCAYWKD